MYKIKIIYRLKFNCLAVKEHVLSLTMKTKQKMKMSSNAGSFRLDPTVDLKSLSFYHMAL